MSSSSHSPSPFARLVCPTVAGAVRVDANQHPRPIPHRARHALWSSLTRAPSSLFRSAYRREGSPAGGLRWRGGAVGTTQTSRTNEPRLGQQFFSTACRTVPRPASVRASRPPNAFLQTNHQHRPFRARPPWQSMPSLNTAMASSIAGLHFQIQRQDHQAYCRPDTGQMISSGHYGQRRI